MKKVFQLGYIDHSFDACTQSNNHYVETFFDSIEEAGAKYDKLSSNSDFDKFSLFFGTLYESGAFFSEKEIYLN